MRKVKMNIAQSLKNVRTFNLYSQKYIAEILGVSTNTYQEYENNKAIIPLKHLNKLSNFYNMSVDNLLGLVDENKNTKGLEVLNIEEIAKKLIQIRHENHLSVRELANILSISSSTWHAYEKQKFLISTHACYDLARNFNISVDCLIGKSDIKIL